MVLALACTVHPVDAQPEPVELELKSYWPGLAGGSVSDIEVVDDLAFLANGSTGVEIIDVSDPANPVWVNSLGSFADNIEVIGNVAFLEQSRGYMAIDISDPSNPVQLGRLVVDTYPWLNPHKLSVAGNLAIVALKEWDSAINLVFDISDPANPVSVGEVGFGEPNVAVVNDVEVVGNLAYMALSYGSVSWLWVTSCPGCLPEEGFVELESGGAARDVEVVGNLAFLARGPSGLEIFDVSDPANPARVGGLDTSGFVMDVEVVGNLAFVADGTAGLLVIDVSDPANPIRVGGFDTIDRATDVEINGERIYLADGARGLVILEIVRNDPPRPVVQIEPAAHIVNDNEETLIISVNNTNAVVLLDGSLSSDPDGDPISFFWFEEPELNLLSKEMETIIVADVGQHAITLVVNDGRDSATASVIFQVITAAQAVEQLILDVNESMVTRNRKHPLISTLKAACASFHRGRFHVGLNQLKAFQKKVKAQMLQLDPASSLHLIRVSQEIMNRLEGPSE